MKLDLLKYRYIYIYTSLALTIASVFMLSFFKLKIGIDFTGGSVLEIKSKIENSDSIKNIFEKKELPVTINRTTENNIYIIKTKTIDEKTKDEIVSEISKVGESEQLQFETIGPTISNSLKNKAVLSVVFASLAIILYIAYAFRNLPSSVSAWRFGIIAVIALLHDVFITTSAFAFLGLFFNFEVDSLFITAILTVMGFSVHDTIVVFDRVRENVILNPRNSFYINTSHALTQTLSRSLSTSLTLIFALSALFVLGGNTLQPFIFVLVFGTIVGTYSSIFIAASLLIIWHSKKPLKS